MNVEILGAFSEGSSPLSRSPQCSAILRSFATLCIEMMLVSRNSLKSDDTGATD
jgi:hypothetical protein